MKADGMSDTIRWIEPFAYTQGAPLPVMPVGTYKRGGRTLDISPADLAEMAANYAAGRPRWDIPLYAGHPVDGQPEPGRLGVAKRMFLDGNMLYAEVEWTPEGEAIAQSGQFGYTSPGVIWSKNGARYDDGSGRKFDNVVEHIALTNMPFFGQSNAIFSAHAIPGLDAEPAEAFGDHSDAQFKTLRRAFERMQTLAAEMAQLATDWAADLPEHKRPGGKPAQESATETADYVSEPTSAPMPDVAFIHTLASALEGVSATLLHSTSLNDLSAMDLIMAKEEIKATLKSLIDQYDADAHGAAMSAGSSGKETPMSEETIPAVEVAPSTLNLEADKPATEDLAATQLAERFAALEAQLEQANTQLAEATGQVEAFKAEAAEQARLAAEAATAQRLAEIRARVEAFKAIGAERGELATRLHTLEQLDADLFGYFDGLLATVDGAIAQTEPFKAKSEETHTDATETPEEDFPAAAKRIHKDEFNADPARLADALRVAQERHPDLFDQQYRA